MSRYFFVLAGLLLMLQACAQPDTGSGKAATLSPKTQQQPAPAMTDKTDKLPQTEEEWKARLSPEQYRVLRQKGTERPHTGQYDQHFEPGKYKCAGCGAELFLSGTKFDAHCGWPSFDAPADKAAITEETDNSFGMQRTEVLCSKCGGHLGHLFDDGPTATGMRYCINSASLDFEPEE